jgi:MFS family permease
LKVGALFSGFLAGFLLKRFGAQQTMLFLCVPNLFSWLLILFAQNVPMLYAARFIQGNLLAPILKIRKIIQIFRIGYRGPAAAHPNLCQ